MTTLIAQDNTIIYTIHVDTIWFSNYNHVSPARMQKNCTTQ